MKVEYALHIVNLIKKEELADKWLKEGRIDTEVSFLLKGMIGSNIGNAVYTRELKKQLERVPASHYLN